MHDLAQVRRGLEGLAFAVLLLPATALLGGLLGVSIALCRWAGEMLARWAFGIPLF